MAKEMRLKGISTIEEANRFLVHYLPVYNRRFAIEPNKRENLHVRAGKVDPDTVLCIKTPRTVRKRYKTLPDREQDKIGEGCRRRPHGGDHANPPWKGFTLLP